MTGFLRTAGAFVLGSIFTAAAMASPAMDAAFNLPEWSEQCNLPSVTASSPITRDSAVQLASDNEPAPADSKQDSCTGCNSGSSCDSCNECSQCTSCCCGPTCYASAGAVILHRSRPDGGIIVGNNPFTGANFPDGRDFTFGWDSGPDVTVGYYIDPCDAIEGRFFDDDGAQDTNTFRTPGGFIGAGFTGPANTLFQGRYTTQFYSSEINWRHDLDQQFAFLAGFRWIELADEMAYRINGTVAEGDYQYNNHLYGGQLGLDWLLTDRSNPLQVKVVGKAGLFGNSNDGGIFEFGGGNPIGSFKGRDTTTSFVGELDFTVAYWFTSHVALRGGYELLWIDDVSLASDAASRSLLNPSLLRTVDDSQDLFYHGAMVGLDFVW